MMDIELLRSHGCSAGSYKKLFSGPMAQYPARVRALVDLISNRARQSISSCLDDWRAYAAIDAAYDVDFQQTSPALIRNILGRKWDNPESLANACESFGLSVDNLFIKETLADGSTGLIPNAPLFYNILLPLVEAYCTIRLAKIFNERNTSPLLEYKPLKETARNQVLCEIITDLVETQSTWYGYPSTLRQGILQMLKYGVALAFTMEEWHCEEQERANEDGTEETYIVKEGLRYHLPHPTRCFIDPEHPVPTVNSDSGVLWGGYWDTKTYGTILDDPRYWNRKSIFSGTNWFGYKGTSYYFEELFKCRMADPFTNRFEGHLNREDRLAWYNQSDRDQAVFVTNFYMKLVPATWGLGKYHGPPTKLCPKGKLVDTYHHPVWHRFILAGDDTVLYAEPCAYNPMWAMCYQYDAQAWQQKSLALKAAPWQDLVGGLLNHIVDVAKQNLLNCTFFDENVVDRDDIEKLQGRGTRIYKELNFIGYDSLLRQRAGSGVEKAFQAVQFAKQSIVELLQALPVVLNIMERVLQVSAQEVGAAASHQQGKEEILQTGSASTNGVLFTGSGVDEGVDAWKRQQYDANMAYRDPEFSAQVSSDIPDLEKHIQELGFSKSGEGRDTVLVEGDTSKLRMEGFAASNQGPDRAKEQELAKLIFSTVTTVAGQPELAKKVGVKRLVSLLEEAVKIGGGDPSFSLGAGEEDEGDQEVPQNIIQAIQQAQQATLQSVEEKVAKPIAQEVGQIQQREQATEQALKKLEQIFAIVDAEQKKAQALQTKVASDAQRKDFQAQKSEQRKDAALKGQLTRDAAKTAAEIELAKERASVQLQVETVKAHHGAGLETAKAAHGAALAQAAAEAQPKKEPKGD